MRRPAQKSGSTNSTTILSLGSLVVLFLLFMVLWRSDSDQRAPVSDSAKELPASAAFDRPLFLYCAAGMRKPIEEIVAAYHREYGIPIHLQFGGSNTLLGQLEVSRTGDLYLAADESYTRLAYQKGLVKERLPAAKIRPVIVVKKGNPKGVRGIADLASGKVRYALGDPDAAAIGKQIRSLLSASGDWPAVQKNATVIKPTVTDVANAVKIGSVDAAIVWDATAAQYPELIAIHDPALDRGTAIIEIAVTSFAKDPTAALHFARFVAAADKGLTSFAGCGIETVEGDRWASQPEITLFAGSVNRRAIESVIREFEDREGVTVNTVYNGCGILTAQMKGMHRARQDDFPDTYLACDVYYLDTVKELFEDPVNISDTDIVLAVQKGNPKNIQSLKDLTRKGIRLALGQEQQCTIGILSRRLLTNQGLYERLVQNGNIVTETPSSALLVPNITTGAADAALAYYSDTLAEKDRLTIIPIESPLAKAIQPFSIAKSSQYKYIGRRLFDAITSARDDFIAAGFNWRLGERTKPIHSKESGN